MPAIFARGEGRGARTAPLDALLQRGEVATAAAVHDKLSVEHRPGRDRGDLGEVSRQGGLGVLIMASGSDRLGDTFQRVAQRT